MQCAVEFPEVVVFLTSILLGPEIAIHYEFSV